METPMTNALSTADLEAVYDALAEGIDRAGDGRAELFLTKLALLLARAAGDRAVVLAAIDSALQDL
jgi:hypothetical protein